MVVMEMTKNKARQRLKGFYGFGEICFRRMKMQIEKLNVFTRETICHGEDIEIANYNIEFEAISDESFIDTAEKVEKIREFIENL